MAHSVQGTNLEHSEQLEEKVWWLVGGHGLVESRGMWQFDGHRAIGTRREGHSHFESLSVVMRTVLHGVDSESGVR